MYVNVYDIGEAATLKKSVVVYFRVTVCVVLVTPAPPAVAKLSLGVANVNARDTAL